MFYHEIRRRLKKGLNHGENEEQRGHLPRNRKSREILLKKLKKDTKVRVRRGHLTRNSSTMESYKQGGAFNSAGMFKRTLLRNRVRCKKCLTTIESKSNYDRETCKCGAVSVDGGLLYGRVIGEEKDFEPLYLWSTLN